MTEGSSWGAKPRARAAAVLFALACVAGCGRGLEAETLPELLDEAVERGLPGIVIIVDSPDPERSFQGAAGLAERTQRVAMTVDAGFRIASNSKTFVALALASMHVDGETDLDRPLAELLDPAELEGIANGESASLRQALQHTSGIVDYLEGDGFWGAVERGRDSPWSIDEALAYARGEPANFAPGAGWDYSNTNYLLGGLVLERASGASWASVVRGRVLDPLGMSRTFVEHGEAPRTTIVHGYSEGTRDMFDVDTGYGLPDGGLVATAPELITFVRAVGGGGSARGALSEAIALMLADPATSPGERYGLGLAEFTTPCGRTIGHGGNLEGYLSEMFYVPDRDMAVVIFVNASDGWVDELFGAIVEHTLELACAGEAGAGSARPSAVASGARLRR